MKYYGEEKRDIREKNIKQGTEISSRLKAINNLEKRTRNKGLFNDTRDKMRKELLEVRKGL